jgi:Lon protease-like protein
MKDNFPSHLPVFPLSGVIYFPKTNLPLNIFEKRYLDLVNDCMSSNKLMGMVQSKKNGEEVYNIGCLGKISDFKKSQDGRIIINLAGITRFEIKKEINNNKLYRQFDVDYKKFENDLTENKINNSDNNKIRILLEKTKKFFSKYDLLINWNEFQKLNLSQQINTLSMIAPISNEEKQKLLEVITLEEKTKILSEIIEFYLYEKDTYKKTIQ